MLKLADEQVSISSSELDKKRFKENLNNVLPNRFSYEELDFIFDVMDSDSDGRLQRHELLSLDDSRNIMSKLGDETGSTKT